MDAILKSTVILAGAWLSVTLLRRRSAALRHLVWCAAVVSLAFLPPMTALLPGLYLPVPAGLAAVGSTAFNVTAGGTTQADDATTAPPSRPATTAGTVPNWWPTLGWIWMAGVATAMARVLVGIRLMVRIRHSARELQDPALDDASARLAMGRGVRLLESPRVGVPMASGIFRPAIYLPLAARAWDAERRYVVLLHELAHILRRDPLTHLAARVTLSALWFHPLAWLAARELRNECERAADDLVLAAGARPSAYAGHLLQVAQTFSAPAGAGWATVCMASRSQLEGRLASILDKGIDRAAARPAFAAAAFAMALALVAPLAAMRPQPESIEPASAAEMDLLVRSAVAARDYGRLERMAELLVRQRKFPEANRLSESALDLRAAEFGKNSPGYATGLLAYGRLMRLEGNQPGADKLYLQVLEIDPGNAAATGYLALSAQWRREFGDAASLYQKALNLAPEAADRTQFLAGLATVEAELGSDAEAEQHYRAALGSGDGPATETATAAELYARFLIARGREDESHGPAGQALRIRAANVRWSRSGPQGEIRKVGGEVRSPRLAFKVEPLYSEAARVAKYTGTVVVNIIIAVDGSVSAIDLRKGIGLGLDEQAAAAIRQWRFEPGTVNGQPVPVAATVEVNFRLQ